MDMTALGGGGGGTFTSHNNGVGAEPTNGKNGGSGGGAAEYGIAGLGIQGNSGGAIGYGNDGGAFVTGGGGAGTDFLQDDTGTADRYESGGDGKSDWSSWGSATSSGENISGTYWYAGGGAKGMRIAAENRRPDGGRGGGGDGGLDGNGLAGTANTGGGGGGAGASGCCGNLTGGSGGSGIVIIRFPDTQNDPVSYTGTKYTSSGYKYFKFTSTGSITF